MGKVASRYLKVDPFKIIENGFHKEKQEVSESLFSLENEYHGIRAFFDETYDAPSLQGSYFNGIYEYSLQDTPNAYKGIVKRTHFMINSVNWVKCKISYNGEIINLNKVKFSHFKRELDFREGG